MSYPVRLEVTRLVGESGGHECQVSGVLPCGDTVPTLPPVASVTSTPVRTPVFVIPDAVNKRPRTAGGVLGCGRVAPLAQVESTSHVATPNSRSHSNPHLTRRRHARVSPLPTLPHTSSPTEPSHSCQDGEGSKIVGGPCPPLHLPKWKREREKGDQDIKSQDKDMDGKNVPPWPSCSLDTEESICCTHFNTTTTNVSLQNSASQDSKKQWAGSGTVPTISVGTHTSNNTLQHKTNNYNKLLVPPHTTTTDLASSYITERIHNLVSAFSDRATRVKAHITRPPSPDSQLSDNEEDGSKKDDGRQRLESRGGNKDEGESCQSWCDGGGLVGVTSRRARLLRQFTHACCPPTLPIPSALEPQSHLYIWWLLVVTVVYTYNAWVIPLRTVFSEYQTEHNLAWWFAVDYLADFVYLIDLVIFKPRVMYLDNGFWIKSGSLMRKHYLKSAKFRYDLGALLPLDLLYLKFGPISAFRLPRLAKIHTFWEFWNRLDTVLASPHAVRVVRTVLYMLFLIHLNTCAYYGFSKLEGIGSNKWVFQGEGHAYIRCFYFATKTATSIGKNPKPTNEAEYLFMTCSWLMGVFVFALLIGQIRDIVATATRNQNEYRRVMDHTQAYLHRLNLPIALQDRVRLWFSYTWQNQKTLDEMQCLESLPRKMRTDIAISVHIQTLSKVQLFQDCDKALLRDLVLKLQPVLYLPGDFVCKKGEVGKEMYIVQSGQVLVMGGEKGDLVLATLGEGSVFGEISLLALAGGNRRTADVRSRGFSSLFVLSKADLQATIKDYPEAQEILKNKAKRLIRQNEEREKQEPTPDGNVIIKSRESTPKLLHAVLQVVRPDSYTANVIRRSSRTASLNSAPEMPCPSDLSHTNPPAPRRASLEVTLANGGPRANSLPKTSLSESLPEEEEEDSSSQEKSVREGEGSIHMSGPCSSAPTLYTTTTLHTTTPLYSGSSSPNSSLSTSLLPASIITPCECTAANNRDSESKQSRSPNNRSEESCTTFLGDLAKKLSNPDSSCVLPSDSHDSGTDQSHSSCPSKHDRTRQPSGGTQEHSSAGKQRGRGCCGKLKKPEDASCLQSSSEEVSSYQQKSRQSFLNCQQKSSQEVSSCQQKSSQEVSGCPQESSQPMPSCQQVATQFPVDLQDAINYVATIEQATIDQLIAMGQITCRNKQPDIPISTDCIMKLNSIDKVKLKRSENFQKSENLMKSSTTAHNMSGGSCGGLSKCKENCNCPKLSGSSKNVQVRQLSYPSCHIISNKNPSVPKQKLKSGHKNRIKPSMTRQLNDKSDNMISRHSKPSSSIKRDSIMGQHSKSSSSSKGSNKWKKCEGDSDNYTNSKSNHCNNSNSATSITTTEDFLIQFGLSSESQYGHNSSSHSPITSPDSYQIFLTELSRTLPSSLSRLELYLMGIAS